MTSGGAGRDWVDGDANGYYPGPRRISFGGTMADLLAIGIAIVVVVIFFVLVWRSDT